MMADLLDQFDRIHIINIVDRTDRRREMMVQLRRVGSVDSINVAFFAAQRPDGPGAFPSVGARGCFESHLAVVRCALADGIKRLLILEDDFDFSADIEKRGLPLMAALSQGSVPWDIFYGASVIEDKSAVISLSGTDGLVKLAPETPVMTASFLAFTRPTLMALEPFLAAIPGRPAGSPDYGPMHVDGAYSLFRRDYPCWRTLAAVPSIGGQRASRSDIAPNSFILDRFALTRPLANRLRRSLERVRS